MRIPFDSLNLAAVVAEAQCLVGARLENVLQPDALTVVPTFWSGRANWLLLSASPNAARAYLLTRRPEGLKPAPAFSLDLRRLLKDATVRFVRQRGLDRTLELGLETEESTFILVAELMGKHSNVMLVNQSGTVVSALKWVGPSKSVRPILPNRAYEPPPFEAKPSLLTAGPNDDLSTFEGASPFLVKLVAAGAALEDVQQAVRTHKFRPTYVPGSGAYPISVEPLGLQGISRESLSQALEQHFESLVETEQVQHSRASLKTQLERVLLAREVALRDVEEAIALARDARSVQMKGELILAYQGTIEPGSKTLDAWDYEGQPIQIAIKRDLNPVENAERFFTRAKKAKNRAEEMERQFERLESDRQGISTLLLHLSEAETLDSVDRVRSEADRNRWLQKTGAAKPKEERPFEGHSIRELLSPGGWRILYGENSTGNDYLTSRVAKPADLWFHVRGAPSAHVLLCTNNQPQRVQPLDLEFAARVAVRHSPSKHSGYVSVDYTQKRYVRKPKGSAPGLAVYTHEKTLHVTGL